MALEDGVSPEDTSYVLVGMVLGVGAWGGLPLCLLPCPQQSGQEGEDRTLGPATSVSQLEWEASSVVTACGSPSPSTPAPD